MMCSELSGTGLRTKSASKKHTTEREQSASHTAPLMSALGANRPEAHQTQPRQTESQSTESNRQPCKRNSSERVICIQKKVSHSFLKTKKWFQDVAGHQEEASIHFHQKSSTQNCKTEKGQDTKVRPRQRRHIDHDQARIAATRVNPPVTHYVTMSYWLPGARHRSPIHASKFWSTPQHGLTVHCDMDVKDDAVRSAPIGTAFSAESQAGIE